VRATPAPGDDVAGADLSADYARAGFGGRLSWGTSPAVVVVDICRAYLEPTSPLYAGVEEAVASASRLVDAAREAGVPVVFTRVEYEPGGADGGRFYQKVPALACFDRGNPLAEFVESPRPRPGEVVVTKQYASAFFATSLAPTLRTLGIDTVVVCGLSTSGCVRATALDALQHGFVPIVVADACGDRDPRPHEANLFDLRAKYAEVVTEADAIDALSPNPEENR
jgi:maleamate amidohydrolase